MLKKAGALTWRSVRFAALPGASLPMGIAFALLCACNQTMPPAMCEGPECGGDGGANSDTIEPAGACVDGWRHGQIHSFVLRDYAYPESLLLTPGGLALYTSDYVHGDRFQRRNLNGEPLGAAIPYPFQAIGINGGPPIWSGADFASLSMYWPYLMLERHDASGSVTLSQRIVAADVGFDAASLTLRLAWNGHLLATGRTRSRESGTPPSASVLVLGLDGAPVRTIPIDEPPAPDYLDNLTTRAAGSAFFATYGTCCGEVGDRETRLRWLGPDGAAPAQEILLPGGELSASAWTGTELVALSRRLVSIHEHLASASYLVRVAGEGSLTEQLELTIDGADAEGIGLASRPGGVGLLWHVPLGFYTGESLLFRDGSPTARWTEMRDVPLSPANHTAVPLLFAWTGDDYIVGWWENASGSDSAWLRVTHVGRCP